MLGGPPGCVLEWNSLKASIPSKHSVVNGIDQQKRSRADKMGTLLFNVASSLVVAAGLLAVADLCCRYVAGGTPMSFWESGTRGWDVPGCGAYRHRQTAAGHT